MTNQNQQIETLYHKWVNKQASEQEIDLLFQLLDNNKLDATLYPLFKATWNHQILDNPAFDEKHRPIVTGILQQYPAISEQTIQSVTPKISLRKWTKVAAAAILILALGSGIYYFNNQSSKSHKSSQITLQKKSTRQDIAPGTNRAILTLSNGTQKQLSFADNGLQLQSDAVLLTTPNGGQYQATLPDGSKVWLNAASSIKFPSKFSSKERKVEVTGEVYFEIAKDASKPFIVSGNEQEIEVLGTSFNVNLYDNETSTKTTLIEGAIKVNNKILQPGQAYINGKIIQANIEQDIAWKNGFFNFHKMPLEQALKQIGRWYDVKVSYQGKIPNLLMYGEMDRDLQLSQVLEILSDMKVKYEMQGRILLILP